jgi:choline dehydrogenase-like flavoprotein
VQTTFDYIIVGAGSAGCVLANRLSADPGVKVALIEAGPSDRSLLAKLLVNIPAGVFATIGSPRYNWLYQYEADPKVGGQPIFCPRGRILGGSSAINGMIYIRGHRRDFDGWAAGGADGWSWREVLPYFRKSENHQAGADELHATGGELDVVRQRDPHPISEALLAAAGELQLGRTQDFNGPEQDGFGYWEVNQRGGERLSSSRAFLQPAAGRPNLTIVTGALTRRVIVENGRARGVEIAQGGQQQTLAAAREVILAAGAINSPQLLMLSGIGPAEELRRHGIEVVCDLPGVGENLQDHQDVMLCWSSPRHTLYGVSWRALPWMLASPFRYAFQRKGPWTTNTVESGGFVRSRPGLEQPDLQIILGPEYMNQNRSIPRGHGFSFHVSLLQSKSRGRITLASADPAAKPVLRHGFLSDEGGEDLEGLVRGFKLVRRLVQAPAMDAWRGEEVLPGPAVGTDDEIRQFVRATLGTTFHPAGTCRMGSDGMAVVDPELKVRGVEGLRVIDASIMPTVTSGNTNAPTIMIAEKGADLVLGRREGAIRDCAN